MFSLCCLPGHRHLFVPPLVAMLVLMLAGTGQAQQRELPATLLGEQSSLDDDQRQVIEAFVASHIEQMLNSDDPAEVSAARSHLLRPLQSQITRDPAHNALSDALADAIEPVMDRNSMQVRLSALLIARELSSSREQVLPLIAESLGHRTPAVRLLAAKSVTQINANDNDEIGLLPEDQQGDLLEALSAAMAEEGSEMVLEEMYRAMGTLTVPQARQVLLNVLGERVAQHTGGLGRSLRADQRGIESVRRSIAFDLEQNQDVDQPLRELTILSARLLDTVTRELEGGQVPETVLSAAVATVATVEEVFDLALDHFDPAAGSGPELAGPVREGDHEELRQNVLEWIGTEEAPGLLTDSAIGVPFAQLQQPN